MIHKFLTPLMVLSFSIASYGQSTIKPEDTEIYSPKPVLVTLDKGIPSDATLLFGGTSLDAWVSSKDQHSKAPWLVQQGILTVKPGSGNIETRQDYGSFQLHVEWRSPQEIKGQGQGRGNSGIFLQGLYEIQVLDNHENDTYVNGQAGSLYKQVAPLKHVLAGPDRWHSYDIIYQAPTFDADQKLKTAATLTVLHNGVLIHHHTPIQGTTEYIGPPQVKVHGDGPIILQDHGDKVEFRNIWIRPL